MNQSETKIITCNRRQWRENARVQQAIAFGFVSYWLRKWASFVNQSQSEVKQNQSKRELLLKLKQKPLWTTNNNQHSVQTKPKC